MVISQKSGQTRYSPRADCFLRTNFHSSLSIGRLFQGFKTRDIKYLKHVPESKTLPRIHNTSQNPKTRPRSKNTSQKHVFWIMGNVFGFWDVFLDSRKCFGFWEVFWILGSVFGSWELFWILGGVLDSWKCFGF